MKGSSLFELGTVAVSLLQDDDQDGSEAVDEIPTSNGIYDPLKEDY